MNERRVNYQTEDRNGDKPIKAIEIRAELRQVKTMVDHSITITLNLPEDCLEQARVLLGWIGNEVKAVIETI